MTRVTPLLLPRSTKIGHDPGQAPPEQPAHAGGEHGGQAVVPGVAAQQGEGDHLAGVGVHGEIEPIAPQGPAVLARPAPAEQIPLATAQ